MLATVARVISSVDRDAVFEIIIEPLVGPPLVLPMFMIVVDPRSPPVPMLIVLVVAVATAPVEILVVLVAVPVYPTVSAVELANAPNVAPLSIDVVNVGAVANTNRPVPVSSDITLANSADVVAENTESLLLVYVTVPPLPNATDELSVPVNVNVLLAVNVLPSAIVKVECYFVDTGCRCNTKYRSN